jgi:hypothetical protein
MKDVKKQTVECDMLPVLVLVTIEFTIATLYGGIASCSRGCCGGQNEYEGGNVK